MILGLGNDRAPRYKAGAQVMHLIRMTTTKTKEAMVAKTRPAVRGVPSVIIPCIEAAEDRMLLAIPVSWLFERNIWKSCQNHISLKRNRDLL